MVVEEPFLSREAILSILRPGQIATEAQFRTLRQHDGASRGLPVTLRTRSGRVVGRVQLYCALNGDAARAYRLHGPEGAHELAARAGEIERSPDVRLMRDAVASVASRLPLDPRGSEAPADMRRYLRLRRRFSPHGADEGALVREWLAQSGAWIATAGSETLTQAIVNVARAVDRARAEILPEPHVTTFYGVVARMDELVAEVEDADGHALMVPRDDLDRQGLASLGQPVAVLRELLPGGGSYSLPMPAASVDRLAGLDGSPFEEAPGEIDDVPFAGVLADRDAAWIMQAARRQPATPIAAPLPIA